jgi:hypothetical protein
MKPTRQLHLAVMLVAGSLLGATTTLLAVDRDPAPAPTPEELVTDVPFTLHFKDPEAPGDYRVEPGWLCDVEVRSGDDQVAEAHGSCREGKR